MRQTIVSGAGRDPFRKIPAGAEAAQIHKKTGNLRAVPLLLGHMKLESAVRCLGIKMDDALAIPEQVEL
jgi:hypothetical protein